MSSRGYYILDYNAQPVEVDDIMEWGLHMESVTRSVAVTEIDDTKVSTVFLGLDHGFGGPGPILWETMIFGGPDNEEQWRYLSRSEAIEGHIDAVDIVYSSMGHIVLDKVLLNKSAPDDSINILKNGDEFIDAFNIYIVSDGSLENPDVTPKLRLEAVRSKRGDDGRITSGALSITFESVEDLESQVDHGLIVNWSELVAALVKAIEWPT